LKKLENTLIGPKMPTRAPVSANHKSVQKNIQFFKNYCSTKNQPQEAALNGL
jgi:hypothetical protein